MTIDTTVMSDPSCERAQATVKLQPADVSIPQNEPNLLVMVSAIDVSGMYIGLHEGTQFVVRWNNTTVPVSAHRDLPGVFVANIEKADRKELGTYSLEIELIHGLNESIGKTVKSCLLNTTTVEVTEAKVCIFFLRDHAVVIMLVLIL